MVGRPGCAERRRRGSLALLTSIQPRPGTIVMRSRRWHPMVPTLNRPHLIRLRLVEVTPRRRCLSTLAEWLTACPTGDSALVLLPTRFYLMMWSTLIRTRLGMTVMRSRQHYRTVLPLSLPLSPRREPRGSEEDEPSAQDARKHQRRRPLAIHGSAPGTDTGSGVRQSDNT